MELNLINKLLQANCTAPFLQEYRKKIKDAISPQSLKNGLLKYRERLAVVKEYNLQSWIIAKAYTQVSTVYPRKNKIYKIINNHYHQPGIVIDINYYVWNCNSCYRSIIPQDKPLELLKPLLIPERPQQYIFIDFYKLPIDYNRYNIVIILVNYFGKRPFLIPYYKNINAKKAAQLYIYYVYQIYRLLDTIISNYRPQFISAF